VSIFPEPKDEVPPCCRNCQKFCSDWDEWVGTSRYCELGLRFPTKRLTCKRQQPIKEAKP
jgi:hypothetical protein